MRKRKGLKRITKDYKPTIPDYEIGEGYKHHLTTISPSSAIDWAKEIERLIKKHTKPMTVKQAKALGVSTKGHGVSNPTAWVRDLSKQVYKRFPREGLYDGNVKMAWELGAILLYWAARVHNAKCMDPRRPVSIRRYSYETRQMYLYDVIWLLLDDVNDHLVFEGQKWQHPFRPGATSGKFV